MAETENEYLQLVGSDSRMTTDDLKLLFTKDLETYPGWWRYMFGLFIGFFFAGVATINSLKGDLSNPIVQSQWGIVALSVVTVVLLQRRYSWERVRLNRLRQYLSAREAIEAKGKEVQRPLREKDESPKATSGGTNFEVDKLRLAWDYEKSIQVSMLAIVFSAFIGSVLTSLLITNRLNPISHVGALLAVFIVISYYIVTIRVNLRRLVTKADERFEELERGESVGSFKALCGIEGETGSPQEEFDRIFPGSRTGVIFVAVLALAMIVLGFLLKW